MGSKGGGVLKLILCSGNNQGPGLISGRFMAESENHTRRFK